MNDGVAVSAAAEGQAAGPEAKRTRPPLSVVIPARDGLAELAPVLEALIPAAEASGTEVVIVGDTSAAEPPTGESVRLLPMSSRDILALRHRGMGEAKGEVVAVGEDHAVPRPDWCEAVIRAHAEHRGAAVIAGCLVNATDATLAGRANFLAFAAAWQPPMPMLPSRRPPPSSALSFKRSALEGIRSEAVGWVDAELIPSLFAKGLMVADERIVVDHFQDHGSLWSIQNAFHSARASYGYKRSRLTGAKRRRLAGWALGGVPRQLRREAHEAAAGARVGRAEAALIGLIAFAAGFGGALGVLLGPGRSPDRVA